jgi:hypothetical protein
MRIARQVMGGAPARHAASRKFSPSPEPPVRDSRRNGHPHRDVSVVLGFDPTSWYGLIVVIFGAYLFWSAVFETGRRQFGWIMSRVRPETPEPPIVRLRAPGYSYSTETITERRLEKRRYLTMISPSYLIEHKDTTTVTDVTTGVRRRDDGREGEFTNFKAAALAAGEKVRVTNASIPESLFDGLTDQDYGEPSFSGCASPLAAAFAGRSSMTRSRTSTPAHVSASALLNRLCAHSSKA